MEKELKEVARLMTQSDECIVVTGAGISTGAGLLDYRSHNGKWNQVDPIEVCSLDADLESEVFIGFWRDLIRQVKSGKPTKAHTILEEWKKRRWVDEVITQNVDGYHGKKNTLEIHGSIQVFYCNRCQKEVHMEEYLEYHICPKCQKGVLRPNIVFFGEEVEKQFEAEDILWGTKGKSILMLIGTSLEVSPLKEMVMEALGDYEKVIVINRELPSVLKGQKKVVFLEGDIQILMEQIHQVLKIN